MANCTEIAMPAAPSGERVHWQKFKRFFAGPVTEVASMMARMRIEGIELKSPRSQIIADRAGSVIGAVPAVKLDLARLGMGRQKQ